MNSYPLVGVWDSNYKSGRLNRFTYDCVVSYVFKNIVDKFPERRPRVLDLGFGGGNHLRLFHQLGFDTFGIEIYEISVSKR